jgi:hypothetical protein
MPEVVSEPPKAGDTCLSVRQPHAHLILAGIKTCENRGRPTRYRGRLLIHASARLDDVDSWADLFPMEADGRPWTRDDPMTLDPDGLRLPPLTALPLDCVLGSVELFDCLDLDAVDVDALEEHDPGGFADGPWVWFLRDPRPLARPVPCTGKLGLWRYGGCGEAARPRRFRIGSALMRKSRIF